MVVVGAAAARGVDEPISFGAAEVLLSGGDATVLLSNDAGAETEVTVSAVVVAGGRTVPLTATFPDGSASAPVPAGGASLVTVHWPASVTPPAAGRLTANARVGSTLAVARVPVRVAAAAVVPAVPSWTVRSVRWGPDDMRPLPLATPSTCPLRPAAPTAVLSADDRTVAVTTSCGADGGRAALSLSAQEFPGTGDYTGTLPVGTDKVALTVRRTFWWWVPALLIVLGWAIALFQQGWIDNQRPVRQLRRRLDELETSAATKQEEFAGAAAGQPWAGYELTGPVRTAKNELSATLRPAGRPGW